MDRWELSDGTVVTLEDGVVDVVGDSKLAKSLKDDMGLLPPWTSLIRGVVKSVPITSILDLRGHFMNFDRTSRDHIAYWILTEIARVQVYLVSGHRWAPDPGPPPPPGAVD